MVNKILVGVVILIILGGAGYYAWMKMGKGDPVPAPVQRQPVLGTYATSTYSIQYPTSYAIDTLYAYEGVPKKPIPGVKFIVPEAMIAGTNLSSDSGVSVEQLPRAQNCTGDIYVYDTVKATDFVTASTTYSVATTSGVGAGNFYEEEVYAIKNSSPCTAVRYFIHSTNLGNYATGTVREFERGTLRSEFDKIRDSLRLTQQATI